MATAEPAPMTTRALLLSVAFAAVVSVFFWHTLPVYPFRLLVTLLHESGHALAVKLVGGSVVSLTISPSEGGLTQSMFSPGLFSRVFVSSAGYVGSSLAGAFLLVLAGRMRSGRFILFGLAGFLALVALVWVPFVPPSSGDAGIVSATGYSRTDGLFTWAFIALVVALLGFVALRAPVWLRRVLIVSLATLSCLAALEDLKALFGYGLGGSSSDADHMQQLTMIPAAVWAALWFALSLAAIAFGLRSIIRRRATWAGRS